MATLFLMLTQNTGMKHQHVFSDHKLHLTNAVRDI